MGYFLVPLVGTGVKGDEYRPKYMSALCASWRMSDCGDVGIVHAESTPAIEAQIVANPDALVVNDATMDSTIDVSVPTVLDTLGLPSELANDTPTYRQVFLRLLALAQLLQRLEVLNARDLVPGKFVMRSLLNSTVGAIPAGVRARIIEASDSFGLDRSALTLTTTVRDAFRQLGLQMLATRTSRLGPL